MNSWLNKQPNITWRKNGSGRVSGRSRFVSGPGELHAPPSILDPDWCPPPEFQKESSSRVIAFWLKTCQEATGIRPDFSVFTMRGRAELLIADLGYVRTLKTLQWMALPLSKYFQWPYGLGAVKAGEAELKAAEAGARLIEHGGWYGPIGLHDLRKG